MSSFNLSKFLRGILPEDLLPPLLKRMPVPGQDRVVSAEEYANMRQMEIPKELFWRNHTWETNGWIYMDGSTEEVKILDTLRDCRPEETSPGPGWGRRRKVC